jgi:hypothetical protein
MNEWETIAWFVGICAAFFGAVWLIIKDVKKGVHARVARCEHVIDEVVRDCSRKKDTFITTSAFDRFEGHLVNRVDNVQKSVDHLTERFDAWLLTNKKES